MRKRGHKHKNSQNKNNEPRIVTALEDERINGKKFVDWRVDKEGMDYVSKHYYTEISRYSIRTRRFNKELCNKYEILRTLNEKCINGYRNLIKPLKKSEKEVLDTYNVPYKPYKLRIFLQRIIDIN